MAQPLENYDDASILIKVDPVNMYSIAHTDVLDLGGSIADSIDSIHSVWESLSVGWVGETATQAQQFNDDWADAIQQLFGTTEHPDDGVLTQIARGVIIASVNYDQAEVAVAEMFTTFTAALGAEGAGGSDTSRNVTDGPISEVNTG